MKPIVYLAFTILCGCASTHTTPNNIINKSDYTPPEQNELIVSDHRSTSPQQEPPTEQQRYEKSLQKINATFTDEYVRYALCVVAKPKNDRNNCQQILKNFCIKDIYLDSRGGWHRKLYCGGENCAKNEYVWCDTNSWICACTK